jgi:hypothetical protein
MGANRRSRNVGTRTLRSMSDMEAQLRRDLALLIDLLGFLPDPDDPADDEWWGRFAVAEGKAHRPGQSTDGWAAYMIGKLADYSRVSSLIESRELAVYCLRFFDSPSREMAALASSRLDVNSSGDRLLESICQVAWRMYVPLETEARRSENG